MITMTGYAVGKLFASAECLVVNHVSVSLFHLKMTGNAFNPGSIFMRIISYIYMAACAGQSVMRGSIKKQTVHIVFTPLLTVTGKAFLIGDSIRGNRKGENKYRY